MNPVLDIPSPGLSPSPGRWVCAQERGQGVRLARESRAISLTRGWKVYTMRLRWTRGLLLVSVLAKRSRGPIVMRVCSHDDWPSCIS
jgi:hypothetical protein